MHSRPDHSIIEIQTPLRGAQSISRAIALLRHVARHNDRGARLSEISQHAGLTLSTTHRLLAVLSAEGLITHDTVSKRYHLGIELYHLGSTAYQYSIREHFRGALERIAQETGDTVFLLIRSGNDALCIDRVEGSYPVRAVLVDIGSRRPLGIGVGSLSLIAFLPPDECETVISGNAVRYGRYKNLSAQDIRGLAKEAKQRGYAISHGLFHEGVISIGIPVINDQSEVLAGIAVTAITRRMDSQRRDVIFKLVCGILREEGLTSMSFKR